MIDGFRIYLTHYARGNAEGGGRNIEVSGALACLIAPTNVELPAPRSQSRQAARTGGRHGAARQSILTSVQAAKNERHSSQVQQI